MQKVCSLVSISFESPRLAKQWKQNIWNFRILIQKYADFCIFKKESGNSFSTKFCVWFFKKNVSQVIFYYLTKFHYVIVFTSWGCDVTDLEINLASNQAVFLRDQKVKIEI